MATLPIGPHRIEEMMRYVVDLAKRMIEAHGAFYPFGAIIDASGERRPVTGDAGRPDASTADVYRLIQRSMRAQYRSNEIVAGCIAAVAAMPPELGSPHKDAIRITVESASISRLVFVPFKVTPRGAGVSDEAPAFTCEFGEYLGVNVLPSLFVDTEVPPEAGPAKRG